MSDYNESLTDVGENEARAEAKDFLALVTSLLIASGGDPDRIVEQAEASVRELKEQRAGFRRGPTHDDARRRLQNARLRTPTPDDRIRGLTAAKLGFQEDIGKLLNQVLPLVVKLAFCEAELTEARAVRDELERGRQRYAAEGVYAETQDFLNALHSDFRITFAHFAAMTFEERLSIARILRRDPDLQPIEEDEYPY